MAHQTVSSSLRRETDRIACIDTIESLARLSWRLIQRKGGEKATLSARNHGYSVRQTQMKW